MQHSTNASPNNASFGATDSDTRETSSLIASDKVEGTNVRRPNGDTIGSIYRLMIDKVSGKVAYAVLSFGGILGLGADYYTLPWASLKYNKSLDAYELDMTEDQLRGAPAFSRDSVNTLSDRRQEEDLHDHYGAAPYWSVM